MKKFLLLSLFATMLFAQEKNYSLPEGIGISNHFEYSYDYRDRIEILENWFNFDYSAENYSAGFRFEIFQPNDPNPAVNRGKNRYADLAFKYLSVNFSDENSGAKITIGNFYEMLGYGLILKSYEDRNIRIDNNLLGIKINAYYKDLKLIVLSGMPENSNAERKDVLHAIDAEYKFMNELRGGFTFASNRPANTSAATSRFLSFRILPRYGNLQLYSEYGLKYNNDIKANNFNNEKDVIGSAFYGNMNFFYESFSVAAEFKNYDNYLFQTSDGTVNYNTPPAVRKEYTYMLLNRHPSPLNQANERGFHIEANYNLDFNSFFLLNFGKTKTLSSSSLYQQSLKLNLPERDQLDEFYLQFTRDWSERFASTTAFGYNRELDANTKNITPIIELKYYYDDVNTFRLIAEHQQTTVVTTNESYFTQVLMLEYLRSPELSISFVGELQTKEKAAGDVVRKTWKFIQFGYKLFEHTDVSLLIGSRQAGNICIGGICRYEPEFNGIEVKMFSRF